MTDPDLGREEVHHWPADTAARMLDRLERLHPDDRAVITSTAHAARIPPEVYLTTTHAQGTLLGLALRRLARTLRRPRG